MNTTRSKDLGLMINIPAQLARRILMETADLPFAEFPAIMILVGIIGSALKTNEEGQAAKLEPKAHVRRVARVL